MDVRKSFDGLAVATRQVIGECALCGHVFVFPNRRGDRVKLVLWDRKCGEGVVIAPAAAKPIDGGLPGGLLAHVLVSNYKDHLPLHPLSGIYGRGGIE